MYERDGCTRHDQEKRSKCDDRKIRTWPGDPETFSGPKHTERGQHYANGKFKHILWHARERTMNDQASCGNQQASRDGTDTRRN
jgi:hypothetical protein